MSARGRSSLNIALFAASNFLGPLTLGRLFDTVGRKPMVSFTYLGSAVLTAVLGVFLLGNDLTTAASGIAGRRRYRPGPGRLGASRGLTASADEGDNELDLDREIGIIGRVLDDHDSANRREFSRRVGARYWGPGRFRSALREAVADDSVKRLRGGEYAPARSSDGSEHDSSRQPTEH